MVAGSKEDGINPTIAGLACLAIDPELRSALMFDASPTAILIAAHQLADMLEMVNGQPVEIIALNSAETEDSLWGVVTLKPDAQGNWISWKISRLTQSNVNPAPRVIVIPDLARLSVPAIRACVMLVGANAATLQRHGQNLSWEPNLWWIAGCAKAEVGEVSPHLLDRFALRLSSSEITFDRVEDIFQWVTHPTETHPLARATIPNIIRQCLQHPPQPLPDIAPNLLPYLIRCVGSTAPGARRDIALARLSRAIATLEGSSQVTQTHINRAAQLIGLPPPVVQTPIIPATNPSDQSALLRSEPSHVPLSTPAKIPPKPEPLPSPVPEPSVAEFTDQEVSLPDTELIFQPTAISATPYPEDTAPDVREANSLQLPPQRYRSIQSTEGAAIGVQKALDLHDIALISTILEAAKFQKVRPAPQKSGLPFRISRADLRSYRRTPVPQQMLVVLMDYTCLKGCNWQDAIFPHLSWAYMNRASACVVQVGSSHALNEFKAQSITERNLLSPRIRSAFEEQRGMATPLAHGLDLAFRVLRSELQHGRGRVHQARLVVISDGRGNIPLAASRDGKLSQAVSREGIEDALTVAREIATLKNVEIFLLDPQPKQYADLPIALAEVMGASLEPISPVLVGR